MKQLIFAVSNSVSQALYEIERLRQDGELSELASRMLEMLYVTGWDDGFVGFERGAWASSLSAKLGEVDGALDELEGLCLIALRRPPEDEVASGADKAAPQAYEVAEIVPLSTSAISDSPELCWWRYYRVEPADRWADSSDGRHRGQSR